MLNIIIVIAYARCTEQTTDRSNGRIGNDRQDVPRASQACRLSRSEVSRCPVRQLQRHLKHGGVQKSKTTCGQYTSKNPLYKLFYTKPS